MRFVTSVVLLASFLVSSVKAESVAPEASTSSAKLPAQTHRQDIDEEITNARLRASTGSKSLFSVQSSFNYNGGSIQSPLSEDRPQLSPGAVEHDPSKLTGQVGMKYRATDHDNINLGVGLGWLKPTYEGQKGQVENPFLAYSRVFRKGDVQNVFEVAVLKYTAENAVRNGKLNFEAQIDHTVLVPIAGSRWQVGLNGAYTREFRTARVAQGLTEVQDTVGFYPFAEYEFNDRISFRTVYRGLTFYNQVATPSTFEHDDETQSMGVGVAVTRDVYLYPNIQWVWQDIRPEKTNVALSANINL